MTEEIRQWVRNKTQAATHYDIAELFGRAYIRAQRADFAINGFRTTGIYPLDRNVFQDHDFIDSIATYLILPTNSNIQQANLINTTQSQITQSQVKTLAQLALAATKQKLSSTAKVAGEKHDNLSNNEKVSHDTDQYNETSNVLNLCASPSTSAAYLSPKQLYPEPHISKTSNNRGRKGSKPTFLTSSPYKLDLETSIKRKEETELLKRKRTDKRVGDAKENSKA